MNIDRERLVDLTTAMVEIPSVNPFQLGSGQPAEAAVGAFFAERLRELGFDIEIDDIEPGRPNVIGRLTGSRPGPTMLLAGHLDTVGVEGYEDPFVARLDGGRIYGRGSCDMKGGLAAILEAARVVGESGFRGELLVIGTADEEDQMIGSRAFAPPVADFGIVAEPTSLAVCPAHKGQVIMFLRTFGVAVHSSVPSEGVNAIQHMGKVITALDGYAGDLAARLPHELCGVATVSAGVIRGGDHATKVPDFCELEVDRRILPGEDYETVYAEYRDLLDGLARADSTFRYELSDPTMASMPLATPVDHDLVTTLTSAIERRRGDATITGFPGGTDAPAFGCPAVICGPGAIPQAHSLDEFVEIDEIVDAAAIYAETALTLLR